METRKLLFFIFLTALMCSAGSVFAGLGISPSDWVEKNGLVGQQIEKTFTLSRSDTAEDLYFTSKITGDLTDWIKIKNGDSFVIKQGQQQFPVNIILSIPQNAEKKGYKGEIRLNSGSKTEQTGQVGVLLSALIRIDLTVSDEPFLSYDVLQIEVPKQEEGEFVNVILKIWNKGNIEAKPTKLIIDILDKFNTTKIDSQIITDFSAITGVSSFSEGQIEVPIPIQLQPEQYWASISVYQDEKILKSDVVTFDIVEAGSLKPINAVGEALKNNTYLLIAGIVLSVILIFVIIIFVVRLFKKRKKDGDTKHIQIHK